MVEKFFFLSGLPRSGSTLLSSILSQNSDIHSEGNSALCQLMWDVQCSCRGNANERLVANNKFHKMQGMICATMPYMYYDGIKSKYVIDKGRSWTLPGNLQLISDYITNNIKIIVMVRPIEDILRSFMQLTIDNNNHIDPSSMLVEDSEPILRSYNGVLNAKKNNNDGRFLFVDYDKMIGNISTQIDRIYSFLNIEPFQHTFNNITNKHHENDEVYGLVGMHDVRPVVAKRKIEYVLPEEVLARCKNYTKTLYTNLNIGD